MATLFSKTGEKPILILKHHPAEGPGRIRTWAKLQSLAIEVVEFNDPAPSHLEPYSALIVLGGPMSALDGGHRLSDERYLIKKSIKQKMPLLGICLGAQMVALELGASVYSLPESESGWMPIQLATSKDLEVPQWHQQGFSLPEGATKLASSPSCSVQMFSWNEFVLGIQFHPEWDDAQIKNLQTSFQASFPIQVPTSALIQERLERCFFGWLTEWYKTTRQIEL